MEKHCLAERDIRTMFALLAVKRARFDGMLQVPKADSAAPRLLEAMK